MKKGILLIMVFAGWFLVNKQSTREVLFSKHRIISEKTGQLVHSWKEQVWQRSATEHRKTPPAIPVSCLHKKKYCLKTIVHLPELKEIMENTGNSNLYPLAPMLIHSL